MGGPDFKMIKEMEAAEDDDYNFAGFINPNRPARVKGSRPGGSSAPVLDKGEEMDAADYAMAIALGEKPVVGPPTVVTTLGTVERRRSPYLSRSPRSPRSPRSKRSP